MHIGGLERPHHAVRMEEVGNNLFGGTVWGVGAETVGLNPLREPQVKKGMTHGYSVGQEINMEKGKPIRRVLRLVSVKTGGCAFGILSICG